MIFSNHFKVLFCRLFSAVVLSSCVMWGSVARSAEVEVFILHSYHQEYPWTKLENDGLITTFSRLFSGKDISYATEYLDTKRVDFSDKYQLFFHQYLQTKYLNYRPDIVFLTDDNALLFYLRFQASLFQDVPVVFCGVNDPSVGASLSESNIYGVFEVKDIPANLLLIQDLLPDSQKVTFIGDNSRTYQAIKNTIQAASKRQDRGLTLEFLENHNLPEVIKVLRRKKSGVLLLTTIGGFHDEAGSTITISNVIEQLHGSGDFVILSMEDVYMQHGVLGGIVTSGKAQGSAAAEKGVNLLAEVVSNPEDKFSKGPNVPTFDFIELERLDIPLSKLPAGAEILHQPLSLYQEFKEIILTAIMGFAVMLVLLVFLSLSFIRRRKAESALQASENFLSSVLDNLPDMVFVKEAKNLEFVRLNKMGEFLVGEKQEKIKGKTDYDFFSADEADFFTLKDRETLEKKVLVDIPVESLQSSQGKRYLHTKKIPILNAKGEAEYLLGISRDITDVKDAEKKERELEEKLKQAQKMESIGTLAGGIAHDFNNILSSIIGYTELAQRQADQPEVVYKLLSGTLKGAERAKQLVRQILTFSRKSEVERDPVVLKEVIEEAMDLLRSSLPSTITIEESLTSRSFVLADSTQMHQIIMNLGTNGYQAMLDTGGTLYVSLDEKEFDIDSDAPIINMKNGTYLHFSMRDTGRGMIKETVERMFDPYFTTKGPQSGTGLGMAVVHGIVKNHGGYISVISELDIGTTVDIYLPVTDYEPVLPQPINTSSSVSGGTESIMLVDDETDIVEMLEGYLGNYGYKVTSFSKSHEALAEFQKNSREYDLIMTDMTMPVMTGTELAKEMFKVNRDIPIILCTGHSDQVSKSSALSMGIKAYCEKPMKIDDILTTIREVLGPNIN